MQIRGRAAAYRDVPVTLHGRHQAHNAALAIAAVESLLGLRPSIVAGDAKLAAELGVREPWHFFWATGALSSFLDNAPTYLVFFKAAQALPATGPTMAGVEVGRLAAVSLGAVFLGAMTYIGNGPNFMVKSIVAQFGARPPGFFGYILYYALPILLPVLALVGWLFLR